MSNSRTFKSFLSLLDIKPITFLWVFVFLQPFLEFHKDTPELNLVKHLILRLYTIGLFLITISYYIKFDESSSYLRFIKRPLFLYVLTAYFSCILAVVKTNMGVADAIISLVTLPILLSLIFIIPQWIYKARHIVQAIRYYIYSIFLILIIGLIEFLINIGTGNPDLRIMAVYSDQNIFARFVLIAFFFVLFQTIYTNYVIVNKKFSLIFLFLALFELIFTFSRSGYITLFICLIVAAFYINRKGLRISLILGVIALSISSYFLLTNFRFVGSIIFEESTFNRLLHALASFKLLETNWLFGIGYTNFSNIFSDYYVLSVIRMNPWQFEMTGFATAIHNWILELWTEQGIFGLFAFCWLFFNIIKELKIKVKQTKNKTFIVIYRGWLFMILIFLIHGLFYHAFITQFFFWVMLGLIIASLNVKKEFLELDDVSNN